MTTEKGSTGSCKGSGCVEGLGQGVLEGKAAAGELPPGGSGCVEGHA